MAVKIRLARQGKKNYAFFNIVVADSRAPRDGRVIDRIGTYNPNTNPASIKLDNEKALKWLLNGAQPTETCRRILSYKGVLLKKHLLGGVAKGALTEEQAEERWAAWNQEKQLKMSNKKSTLIQSANQAKKEALEEEKKTNIARQELLDQRRREEEEAAAKAAAQKAADEAAAAAEIAAAKAEIEGERAESDKNSEEE